MWWLVACSELPFEGSKPADSAEDTAESTPLDVPLALDALTPRVADPAGGSRLALFGEGFLAGAVSVHIGGNDAGEVSVVSDTELLVKTGPLPAGDSLDLTVIRGDDEATLPGAVDVFSPAQIPGVRLFDAASGVSAGEPLVHYEWQRLTPEIHPDWRARDGNTLTFLPSTGRFWMVGGWNPYQEPVGFNPLPPEQDPSQCTTDEVWSSADGVTWTPELPHGHGAFERRHVHNTVLWRSALWVIGGDSWQGTYNHDVLRSEDGVVWEEVLPPGAPPWEPRALQISGTHDDRLWTGFGQDLLGYPSEYTHHNDLWVSDDGESWTLVAPDGPGTDERPEPCGMQSNFVSFRGEMWLLGCARYDEIAGHEEIAEVWSTGDGERWTRHADPPWSGKGWANALVWRDRLWILFGYTDGDPAAGWPAGNASEVWSSEDGEIWTALPPDAPAPGSHAQGVDTDGEILLYAGGNYTFGFGAGLDLSAWRLVPFEGQAVSAWTDRGEGGLTVWPSSDEGRPLWIEDGLGPSIPGLHFDGSDDTLSLPDPSGEVQESGRTALWVARAPHLPGLYGWDETYAPVGTVLGGLDASGMPSQNLGYTDGSLVVNNRADAPGIYGEPVYQRITAGEGLQEGPGEVRFVGWTHTQDGTLTAWIDGAPEPPAAADYGSPRTWTTIGGGMEGAYYGPNSRFGGTLGAVIVAPRALDAAEIELIYEWSRGRFGAR